MSQSTPPQVEGQIGAPTRLEIFWESNRHLLTAAAIAAALAIAANYVIQYYQREARDATWSALATTTGLDQGYAADGTLGWLIRQNQNPQFASAYFSRTASDLIGGLGDHLKPVPASAPPPEVVKGTPAEPFWLWTCALAAVAAGDWDSAESRLTQLEQSHPDHLLCSSSPYPVQWRKPLDEPKPDAPVKDPELAPARSGSAVSYLREQIAEQRAFQAENRRFFEATPPTSPKTVLIEFTQNESVLGQVRIRFYSDVVPTHYARLLQLGEAGFWQGMRVHQVRRKGSDDFGGAALSEFAFGWPTSREDDESKWKSEDVPAENILDWEGEGSGLSHFPGTVAVASHEKGRSQVQEWVITAEDSTQSDGTRVIIGQVVEGLDVVRRIVRDTSFADDAQERSGTGRPADRITISRFAIE